MMGYHGWKSEYIANELVRCTVRVTEASWRHRASATLIHPSGLEVTEQADFTNLAVVAARGRMASLLLSQLPAEWSYCFDRAA